MVTGLECHVHPWLLAGLWLAHVSCGVFRINKMVRNSDKGLCTKIYKCQDSFFYSGNSFVVFSHATTLLVVKIK